MSIPQPHHKKRVSPVPNEDIASHMAPISTLTPAVSNTLGCKQGLACSNASLPVYAHVNASVCVYRARVCAW